MDSGDLVVKFAPMIAGAALLAAFILDFVRNQKLSALSALIPVLGAVLIMAPVLASFTLKGSGFEISANIRGQIGEQGAELKRQLADLRNEKLESTLQSLLPANTPIVDRYREVLVLGRRANSVVLIDTLSR